MKKVLFMPFLQLPSGHHQVADAIIESLTFIDPTLICHKVDILQYSYGKIEALVSSIYLKWIHLFPKTYSWLYRKSVYQNIEKDKEYVLFEILFKRFVYRLISESKPNLIICSHALPSYMLNKLKEQDILKTPVINVYTDYFIHSFWGLQHIDYHFVAHQSMKSFLLKKGVDEQKIFVTGIPVHPTLTKNLKKEVTPPTQITCTIMGGSLGVGAIEELSKMIQSTKNITFYILCGKNQRLFNKLKNLNHSRIFPLPYLSSREEMDALYQKTDVVLTKPGGVTISECLIKKIPVFIYHALPGQEEINLQELLRMGLVVKLPKLKEITDFESLLFSESKKLKSLYNSIDLFHNTLNKTSVGEIIHNLLKERGQTYA
ncbi:MGDG synthase family glycosyltransferase [Fredinandcohnia humi]